MQARDLKEEAGEESLERRNKQEGGESLNKFKSRLESRAKVKSPLTARPIYVGTSPCLHLPAFIYLCLIGTSPSLHLPMRRRYVGDVCRRKVGAPAIYERLLSTSACYHVCPRKIGEAAIYERLLSYSICRRKVGAAAIYERLLSTSACYDVCRRKIGEAAIYERLLSYSICPR